MRRRTMPVATAIFRVDDGADGGDGGPSS